LFLFESCSHVEIARGWRTDLPAFLVWWWRTRMSVGSKFPLEVRCGSGVVGRDSEMKKRKERRTGKRE